MASKTIRSCWARGRKPDILYKGEIRQTFVRKEEFAAFINIPYAVPPEGLNRYQAAESFPSGEPLDEPRTIYKCTKPVKMSAQPTPGSGHPYLGSPDCLYLNIFLPKDPAEIEDPLPVLVYIHGGGFTYGSNCEKEASPDFIVHHGLVFVTINYRLGVLGFLNMGTRECPGNTGLKDQVKALEWIRDNIEGFKGDPANVTLSGCSAGGTCVNMHLISESSKDLFHKAIVQSGGIYSPWGFRGHQRERRKIFFDDPEFQHWLLAPQDSNELHKRAKYLLDKDIEERHPRTFSPYFGPTIEKFREGGFLTENIEERMNRVDHDKPVMAGITTEEGIFECIQCEPLSVYNECIKNDRLFCHFLMDNLRWSFETARNCFREIKNRYFLNPRKMSQAEKDRCTAHLLRDIFFRRFYDGFKFGPEKTIHKNLFVYRFDHVSEISKVQRTKTKFSYRAATHGDDLKYLQCPEVLRKHFRDFIYPSPRQNKEIETVMNHMCSIWANFCRNGIPKSDYDSSNVEWRRHTEENPCFMSISKNLRLIEEPLYKKEWDWLNAFVNAQPTIQSPPDSPE